MINNLTREDLPHIHTFWHKRYYVGDPYPEDVCIEDIAHALSHVCRFVGHVKSFYSVAEHSCRVSYLCSSINQLYGLLHDASETYVGDVTRPLKYSQGMEVYRDYERKSKIAIMKRFGLSEHQPMEVKLADDKLLVTEQRDLMWKISAGNVQKERVDGVKPLSEKIVPWTPEEAKRVFLMTFYSLTNVRSFYRLSTRG